MDKRYSSVAELAQALIPFGRRSSRVHAERAGRVLSASGAQSPDADTGMYSSVPAAPAEGWHAEGWYWPQHPNPGVDGARAAIFVAAVVHPGFVGWHAPPRARRDRTRSLRPSRTPHAKPSSSRVRGSLCVGIAVALLTRAGSSAEPERTTAPVLAPANAAPSPRAHGPKPNPPLDPVAAQPAGSEMALPPSRSSEVGGLCGPSRFVKGAGPRSHRGQEANRWPPSIRAPAGVVAEACPQAV